MTDSRLFSTAFIMGLLCVTMPFANSRAATYTAQEQANMKLVADFYAALDDGGPDLKQKIRGIAEKYLKPDYIQHMEQQRQFGPGREGFIRMFEQMPAMPAPPAGAPPAGAPTAGAALPRAKLLLLSAQGDLVVQVTSRNMGGKDTYIFNMFRVQDGKLAEHWDASSGAGMGMGRASDGANPSAKP